MYQSTEIYIYIYIYIYILCYRVLCYKAFNTANNPKYDGYHRGLASLKGSDLDIKENEKLAEEFQKPVNKSFWKRKVYSLFKDNISGVDPTDMQSISKFNEEICFLLCVIGISSKYAWVVPLKGKKVLRLLMLFKRFRWIST